jgi:hypothetical protein
LNHITQNPSSNGERAEREDTGKDCQPDFNHRMVVHWGRDQFFLHNRRLILGPSGFLDCNHTGQLRQLAQSNSSLGRAHYRCLWLPGRCRGLLLGHQSHLPFRGYGSDVTTRIWLQSSRSNCLELYGGPFSAWSRSRPNPGRRGAGSDISQAVRQQLCDLAHYLHSWTVISRTSSSD